MERTPLLTEKEARWVPEPVWTVLENTNSLTLLEFESRTPQLADIPSLLNDKDWIKADLNIQPD
jgi:hypothetical protein